MIRLTRLLSAARVAVALGVLAALLVPAAPAWAHNALRESTPAEGARLTLAPRQVELSFVERLDARFTTVAVTAPGDVAVAAGAPAVSGSRATQPLAPDLPAGSYTVAYRVVSVDGHPVQGSYTFTVSSAPGASPATSAASPSIAPSPTVSPSPAVPAAGSAGGDSWFGTGVVVVLVVLAAAAVGLLAWRTRAARR
ncbi:copper resistance CopC family protein [Micromonospora aurantiaca (nom. illeg.)]|uniref:copper resistance CopC family protein n=1 Tax=Micromonospora aurantiaca (nom. illeg.) TaxID=47850 RepID=UPI003DA56A1D